MNFDLSIVICTCNRPEHLQHTLGSIYHVCIPENLSAELIVVDNAPEETTAQVVRETHLPGIQMRYVAERRRGKGYAYNRGVAEAQGDILIFTDDDVRPTQNWIAELCAPLLSNKAQAVQGAIQIGSYLHREWMTLTHRGWLAEANFTADAEVNDLIGANMAFAREVLMKVPAFDSELGPGALGFWEDTLFARQLTKAGYHIVAAPNAIVEHHFDEKRLSRASFLDRAQKEGRSTAYIAHHWEHKTFVRPRLMLARAQLRLAYYRCCKGEKWFYKEGAPVWEMLQVADIAFWRQYHVERHRPRNYAKHGLENIALLNQLQRGIMPDTTLKSSVIKRGCRRQNNRKIGGKTWSGAPGLYRWIARDRSVARSADTYLGIVRRSSSVTPFGSDAPSVGFHSCGRFCGCGSVSSVERFLSRMAVFVPF